MNKRWILLVGCLIVALAGVAVLSMMRNEAQTRDEMDARMRSLFRHSPLVSIQEDLEYPSIDIIPTFNPTQGAWAVSVPVFSFELLSANADMHSPTRKGYIYLYVDGELIAHLDHTFAPLPSLTPGYHYIAAGLEDPAHHPYVNKAKLVMKVVEGEFTESGTFIPLQP